MILRTIEDVKTFCKCIIDDCDNLRHWKEMAGGIHCDMLTANLVDTFIYTDNGTHYIIAECGQNKMYRLMDNLYILKALCDREGIDVKSFTPYHHRFTLEGLATFDYYNVSGKINQVGTSIYDEVDIIQWFNGRFL